MFDGWKTLEWACGGGWVGLLHEKASKVCLMGGRPWSGRAMKDVLAHRMGRRGRCVWVAVLVVGVRCRMGWPIEWEDEQGVFDGWKALEWECGGGWVGRVNRKARKVCVGRGPCSGSSVKDGLAHRMGR